VNENNNIIINQMLDHGITRDTTPPPDAERGRDAAPFDLSGRDRADQAALTSIG
jgi:hypothetical protein